MSDFILLNGFDRSGSSAISRTLTTHPEIELIMQPFNSGFIRKKLYQIFDETDKNSEAFQFFEGLRNNEIREEFIHSHWYFNHSTTRKYQPDKIHLIKTTINHFAQKWMKEHFNDIDVWGIWREPQDIVFSIIRNGFFGKWYPEGVKEITPTVLKEPELKNHYQSFINELDNEIKTTSFLLAVRSHFFFRHLDKDKLIVYEDFRDNPNYLWKFTRYYGLQDKDFSNAAKGDLNIIGKREAHNDNNLFKKNDIDFMNKIFEPLKNLKKEKFND
jgi:hypothetical protein